MAAWRAEGASTDWCWLRAASVTGTRHRLRGETGEDAFAWAQGHGWLAVAVADGLGSVEGSGQTAERAAGAAVDAAWAIAVAGSAEDGATAEAGFDGARAAVDGARAAVTAGLLDGDRAAAGGGATTLVLAVVHRDGHLVAGRVGDSTAFVVATDGSWSEVFESPDDDRIGTETASLPSDGRDNQSALADGISARLVPGRVLVLATDGIADPWRDGPSTVAPALVEGLLAAPSALELAVLCDFSRQGCHDDRTLLCVRLDR